VAVARRNRAFRLNSRAADGDDFNYAGLARIIQGLSLGGEYGTSATYLAEVADEKHRGFYPT